MYVRSFKLTSMRHLALTNGNSGSLSFDTSRKPRRFLLDSVWKAPEVDNFVVSRIGSIGSNLGGAIHAKCR